MNFPSTMRRLKECMAGCRSKDPYVILKVIGIEEEEGCKFMTVAESSGPYYYLLLGAYLSAVQLC